MSIARRIRAAREYAGFDQAKLGRRAGVSQQAVQKWEKNGVSSTLRLAKIACVCGVNFEWLSTGRGEMTPTTLARTGTAEPKGSHRAIGLAEEIMSLSSSGKLDDEAIKAIEKLISVVSKD